MVPTSAVCTLGHPVIEMAAPHQFRASRVVLAGPRWVRWEGPRASQEKELFPTSGHVV
jgi:hypothetical protein